MDRIQDLEEVMRCDICGGKRRRTRVTYSVVYNGKPVVVENVPAEVCEQCGEQYFDPDTVEALQKTIGGKKKPQKVIKTPVYDLSAV